MRLCLRAELMRSSGISLCKISARKAQADEHSEVEQSYQKGCNGAHTVAPNRCSQPDGDRNHAGCKTAAGGGIVASNGTASGQPVSQPPPDHIPR